MTFTEALPMLRSDPAGTAMSRREQLTFVVFSTWMISGLFLDGWAHRNDAPETFFTPWHGILYSGFVASLVWGVFDGSRQAQARRRRGEARQPVAGEGLTLVGGLMFGAAALSDMAWHMTFGVEQGFEALLSPTHLALMLGGALAASAPLRAAWVAGRERAPSFAAFWPVALSAAMATALALFFTQFANAFVIEELTMATEEQQVHGVASVLVTTAVLLIPALALSRRWAVPAGTFVVYFGAVSVLSVGLDGFAKWPLAAAALIAGATADLFVARRSSLMAFAAGTSGALWTSFFLVFALTQGVGWTAEMWTGSIILATLLAGSLGLLASRPSWEMAMDSPNVGVDHATDDAAQEASAR